jgi:hypothetical protein
MTEPPEQDEPIEWHRDPAASGWRSRAFLDKGEVVAYDDGHWFVCLANGQNVANAHGDEPDAERAKARALAVYEALTS